jgi:hypothetical protein
MMKSVLCEDCEKPFAVDVPDGEDAVAFVCNACGRKRAEFGINPYTGKANTEISASTPAFILQKKLDDLRASYDKVVAELLQVKKAVADAPETLRGIAATVKQPVFMRNVVASQLESIADDIEIAQE